MKITEIKTFLMSGGGSRNWCFVKVYTDAGIYGVGEGSGWPRVVRTAVEDLSNVIVGEDPMDIERLHQKMIVAMMGHGMTGTPGSGAINAIDIALWDIKGQGIGHTGMELARRTCPQTDPHLRPRRHSRPCART